MFILSTIPAFNNNANSSGDYNNDGKLDYTDFEVFQLLWSNSEFDSSNLTYVVPDELQEALDLNKDGKVNGNDGSTFYERFFKIPEFTAADTNQLQLQPLRSFASLKILRSLGRQDITEDMVNQAEDIAFEAASSLSRLVTTEVRQAAVLKAIDERSDLDGDGKFTSSDLLQAFKDAAPPPPPDDQIDPPNDQIDPPDDPVEKNMDPVKPIIKDNKLGNFDKDGDIDNDDVALLDKIVKGEIILEDESTGDIDGDGDMDSDDVTALQNRLKDNKKSGDVTGDGNVDDLDVDFLNRIREAGALLTASELQAVDVNHSNSLDGTDIAELEKRLEFEGRLFGDLNNDGELDEKDRDIAIAAKSGKYILTEAEQEATESDETPTLSKFIKLLNKRLKYNKKPGDINNDKKVTDLDLALLEDAVNGDILLTDAEIQAIDTNGNGIPDDADLDEFEKRFEERLFGDLNNDNKLDDKDYDIAVTARNGGYILTAAELKAIQSKDSTDLASFIKLLDKRRKERQAGDVNGDEKLSNDDITLVEKYMEGKQLLTDVEIGAIDLDGDGELSEEEVEKFKERFESKARGDINGDKELTPDDLTLAIELKNNNVLLTEAEKAALDTDDDNEITQKDIDALAGRFRTRKVGDLNGDDIIDYADVGILNDYVTGLESQAGDSPLFTEAEKEAADINGDGEINNTDTYLLAQQIEFKYNGLGDLNGDDEIDRKDLEILKDYLDGKITLTDEQLQAANIWDDGSLNIDFRDYAKLKEYVDLLDPPN